MRLWGGARRHPVRICVAFSIGLLLYGAIVLVVALPWLTLPSDYAIPTLLAVLAIAGALSITTIELALRGRMGSRSRRSTDQPK